MKQANTDTTYCINDNCKEKCWRYKDNYNFEKDTNYWFQEKCIKSEYSINIPIGKRREKNYE